MEFVSEEVIDSFRMSQTEIGSWEKHTKGIGLKLLQKFGFKGRLGANEDGISAAVQVVVRPTNVGLGFGDTIEAPNLPENKKIEAEWKGVEYVEPTKPQVAGGGWKKSNYSKKKKQRYVSFDAETNLFNDGESDPQIIVDMRYGENKIVSSDDLKLGGDTRQPVFGEEFLYNVGLVTKLQKVVVDKEIKAVAVANKRKIDLQSQYAQQQAKRKLELSRITILSDIATQLESSQCSSFETMSTLLQSIFREYPEEFELFNLIELIPLHLTTAFQAQKWSVNSNPYFLNLILQILSLVSFFEDQNHENLLKTLKTIISKCIEMEFLPSIRRYIMGEFSLNSSSDLIMLLKNLQYVVNGEVFNQFIDSALIPKLVSTIETPATTYSGSTSNLLQWAPFLKSKLSDMMSSIKRLILKRASGWNPTVDDSFYDEMLEWRKFIDIVVIDKIVAEYIVPKLIQLIRLTTDGIVPSSTEFLLVSKWFVLIPAIHLECLLLCELCPIWLTSLYNLISCATTPANLSLVYDWYIQWRRYFESEQLLSEHIRTMLNVGVIMLKSALASWHSIDTPFEVFEFLYILDEYKSLRYNEVLENKLLEQLIINRIENKTVESESKTRFSSVGGSSSIKDVLESLALRHGIEFVPKHGKIAHGRPVWCFGSAQIYFDGNVVFIYRPNNNKQGMSPWCPIGFEELVNEQKQN